MQMRSLRVVILFVFLLTCAPACGLGSGTATDQPAPMTEADLRATVTADFGARNAAVEKFPQRRYEVGPDLYVREVLTGTYVVTHAFPWPANSLAVVMGDADLLLVDTPYTPEATRDLLAWLELHTGKRNVTAINTGFHYDNLGGNGYLVEQGIPVYGSDRTVELLAERGEDLRALTLSWLQAPRDERYHDAHAELEYVPPTELFVLEEGIELQYGDETVQVYYPGPSHTPDNLVVYFPDRKVLFGGCMVIGGDEVGNLADADLAAWMQALLNLMRFDAAIVVPGHGERLDFDLLHHTLDLLSEIEPGAPGG